MEEFVVETGNNQFGTLSSIFSSRAVAQILDFFLDHKEFDYSANEIAKKTGLSFRTVFREIPDLEDKQLIFNTRKIGKANMYKLNTDLDAVGFLEKFTLEMSQVVAEEHMSHATSSRFPSEHAKFAQERETVEEDDITHVNSH
jgi:DNA-binding Lrp family transcriptional regulator